MKDIVINNRYRVDYRIGKGGFGLVYAGTDLELNEQVAIKLMHIRKDFRMLNNEAQIYNTLLGGVGVPRVRWVGEADDYYAMVYDLLGPSLQDLFNYCHGRFSLKTVLLIAEQAISRLQFIHEKGFVHRDIKPENLLMGCGKQGNILYTIDFGLANELCRAEEDRRHEHYLLGTLPFGGTNIYASINNHCGREQSEADDLESLGYVLINLYNGSLPWEGFKASTEKGRDNMIKESKMNLPLETLCKGLPGEFAQYINYTRSLGFENRPDYVYLRGLFQRVFKSHAFQYDNIFDWTEKLFHEAQAELSKSPNQLVS